MMSLHSSFNAELALPLRNEQNEADSGSLEVEVRSCEEQFQKQTFSNDSFHAGSSLHEAMRDR